MAEADLNAAIYYVEAFRDVDDSTSDVDAHACVGVMRLGESTECTQDDERNERKRPRLEAGGIRGASYSSIAGGK